MTPYNIWDILVLKKKKKSLFTWNSSLPEHLVFLFAKFGNSGHLENLVKMQILIK